MAHTWQAEVRARERATQRKEVQMAARNTGTDSTTALALQGAQPLDAWLDNPENWNTVPVMKRGKKVGERKVRKTLTLSTGATTDLYVAACVHAGALPGGLDDGDLSPGFLGRAVRQAAFGLFLPEVDVAAWEAERAERISAERSVRMGLIADKLSVTREAGNSLVERLLANPKTKAAIMEQADPEMLELLELLSAGDTDA